MSLALLDGPARPNGGVDPAAHRRFGLRQRASADLALRPVRGGSASRTRSGGCTTTSPMFVGGIRALLLQSLHPVAMAAVSAHSGFRGDPWGRLHRTSHFLATTTYGTIADAERSIAIVNAIHGRVRGRTPEGVAYRADDPELLAWIHLAEVDSFLGAHQALGGAALERRRRRFLRGADRPGRGQARSHRPAPQCRGSPRPSRRLPARAAFDGGGARGCRPASPRSRRSPGWSAPATPYWPPARFPCSRRGFASNSGCRRSRSPTGC